MCGFAGISVCKPEILQGMGKHLKARAIDGENYYYDENCSFYHAHLQVSDLDKNTQQPFLYKNLVIGLVGEIYNKGYLLEQVGKNTDENCVTECEVIAYAYEELGENFIHSVNGEFAIYIYDKEKEKHFLFRDRWGVNNVYYKIKENHLYFASEIKCLVGDESKLSTENLVEHFVFQFGISPSTFINNIFTLRPGTYLEFHQGIKKIKDFSEYIFQENTDIISTIEQSVIRRIPQFQKRIFVSLSGGPDSNIILFFLKKYFPGEIIAYSFLTYKNQQDIRVAQKNAQKHNIKHLILDMNVYSLGNDSFEHEGLVGHPNIGKILRENFPEYSDIKVDFGGDGKEEIILGNTHFPYQDIIKRYQYFHSIGKIKHFDISQKFLNYEMFDYNLQMIDKLTLRNGIERRLPFTDYEMLRFLGYKHYRKEIESFLLRYGIELASGEYGFNLGLKFTYFDMKDIVNAAKIFLSHVKNENNDA